MKVRHTAAGYQMYQRHSQTCPRFHGGSNHGILFADHGMKPSWPLLIQFLAHAEIMLLDLPSRKGCGTVVLTVHKPYMGIDNQSTGDWRVSYPHITQTQQTQSGIVSKYAMQDHAGHSSAESMSHSDCKFDCESLTDSVSGTQKLLCWLEIVCRNLIDFGFMLWIIFLLSVILWTCRWFFGGMLMGWAPLNVRSQRTVPVNAGEVLQARERQSDTRNSHKWQTSRLFASA